MAARQVRSRLTFPLPNDQGFSRFVGPFFEFDDKMFITAYDTIYGYEIWVMEEEKKGFGLFTDIEPGNGYSNITAKAEFKGKIYFLYNNEIWTTDGTIAGTQHLVDFWPAISSWFFVQGDKMYLIGRTEDQGAELWVTDGTADGFHLIKDIAPGTLSSNPRFDFGF